MNFCWCTITVSDLEQSIKFYHEIVGLKVSRRLKAGPDIEIAFMGDGETKVELMYNKKAKEVEVGKDICLGFEVKSVDEMMVFVKEKGLDIHSGPFQPNPQLKFFYVLDPNKLKIQFVENL